ncbi:MAG: uracil phosphoribosyltransferase [Bacteroidota bacterium]
MFILTNHNSIANHFLAELRDRKIQKNAARFRHNLQKVGEILAYEISKTLNYQPQQVDTPLGKASTHLIPEPPVLATILRAGLPFYQGFLHYFEAAESAFVGAYRGPQSADHQFEIIQGYAVSPDLTDKDLILIDPMLASGKSIIKAYEDLSQRGRPHSIHIAAVIASKQGVDHVQRQLPQANIWLGDLDQELNDKAYIVPGLGDAGDLAFGPKD